MKKLVLALGAAALLMAPVSVLGQDAAPINQQAAPDGQVPMPTTPVNIDVIIAAANNMQADVPAIADFQDVAKLFIVPTDEFLAGPRGAELTTALQKDESEFQSLRDSLETNTIIVAELERQNLTVDNVVAIDYTDEGEFLIFIQ